MKPLSPDQIVALLDEDKPRSLQRGPLRWYDVEMRCANRGCGSSTYTKLQGVPRCMKHAMTEMNLMLVEAGFEGIT